MSCGQGHQNLNLNLKLVPVFGEIYILDQKIIPWEQWEQETVLPTPGICSALKPILPLLPPLGGHGGT